MGIEIKKTAKKDNPEEFWNSGKLKLEENESVTICLKSKKPDAISTFNVTRDGKTFPVTLFQASCVVASPDVEKEDTFFMNMPAGMNLEMDHWYKITKTQKGHNCKFTYKDVTEEMQELNQPKDKKVSTPSPSSPTPLKAPQIDSKTISPLIPTSQEEEVLKAVRANEQFIINVRNNLPWFHEWFKQNNIDISVNRVRGLAELL